MALQGKILFIIALAFFIQKVRSEVETVKSAHLFITRDINDEFEAEDDVDEEDVVDIPITDASVPIHRSTQRTTYEDLHSPEVTNLLTEEYVGLVETQLAAQTVDTVMEKIKSILGDKRTAKNVRQLRLEVYKYMTNPNLTKMIEGFFERRYKHYVNEQTPDLMRKKYDTIKSVVNNENIPKHIEFGKRLIVHFLTQPGDVKERIARGFATLNGLLNLPQISL